MRRAVVLTALPVEYLAVRRFLTEPQEEIHPQGTIYERGHFVAAYQTWEVGIAEVGAGNAGTAVEAERAISHFKPDIVFFVGIAGGIKDVQIGDVVAATKVYGYEFGKDGKHFSTRPTVGQSAYALVQRAKSEARKSEWVQRIRGGLATTPSVFVAPIAAGEKVLASRDSELFQFLRTSYNDAIAVEMEGLGFLSAAFAYPNIKAIVIRGISDLIEGKNANDSEQGTEEKRQERAAHHATAFAFELLAKFYPNLSKKPEPKSPPPKQIVQDFINNGLSSRDPFLANRASATLIKHPKLVDLVPHIIDRISFEVNINPITNASIKKILRLHPTSSSKVLINRLKNSNQSRQISGYFDPALGHYCQSELLKNLQEKDDIELTRMSIIALGHCSYSYCGTRLRELIKDDYNDYDIRKLGFYILISLARLFVRSININSQQAMYYYSQDFCEELSRFAHKFSKLITPELRFSLKLILKHCTGYHADVLIKDWLNNESTEIVRLAAFILGTCKIERAVQPLIRTIDKFSDPKVVFECTKALGQISTNKSVQKLFENSHKECFSKALIYSLGKNYDRKFSRKVIKQFLESTNSLEKHKLSTEYLILIRAIGLKDCNEFSNILHSGIDSTNPSIRGHSTLALSRLHDPTTSTEGLINRLDQAQNHYERIFTTLAILIREPSSYSNLESELRLDLCHETEPSFIFISEHQTDILNVLRFTKNKEAIELADAWMPFYANFKNYEWCDSF